VKGEAVHACGSSWHKRCLKCHICRVGLSERPFVNVQMDPWCVECCRKAMREGKFDKRWRLRE
jgi:hypothetical protein